MFLHSRIKDVQVVFNCQDSIAQTRTWENIRVCLFTGVVLDDVMSQSEFSTSFFLFQNFRRDGLARGEGVSGRPANTGTRGQATDEGKG